MLFRRSALLVLLIFLFIQIPSIFAATIVVTASDGTIADNGECSLSEAIINANMDDQSGSSDCIAGSGADTITLSSNIELVASYVFETGDNGLPLITSEITIDGQGFSLTRTGDERFRFLYVAPQGMLTINNTTLSNGYEDREGRGGAIYSDGILNINNSFFLDNIADGPNGGGGAIFNFEGTVNISGSEFTNNSSTGGNADAGAIFNVRGNLTISQSTFDGNTTTDDAGDGGAIFSSRGVIFIEDSIFSNNQTIAPDPSRVGSGGALYSNDGAVEIINSTFTGNRVNGRGFFGAAGAIFVSGPLIVRGSTFTNNVSSAEGGAINVFTSSVILENNTISGNISLDSSGGGVRLNTNTARIINNTIVGNSADRRGGGIETSYGDYFIANNIIAGNFVGDSLANNCSFSLSAGITSMNNLSDTLTCGAGFSSISPGTDYDTLLADNGGPTLTHQLFEGSVALDSALGIECPATDQRGITRGFDADAVLDSPEIGDCDIGAYEYQVNEPDDTPEPDVTPEPDDTPEPETFIMLCHVVGRADNPANGVVLNVPLSALNGHIDNNGTNRAGHEVDFVVRTADDVARCNDIANSHANTVSNDSESNNAVSSNSQANNNGTSNGSGRGNGNSNGNGNGNSNGRGNGN